MKRMIFVRVNFYFLLSFLLSSTSFAAAWVQPQGGWQLLANTGYYNSCQFWDIDGNLRSGPCFRQFTFNPYFEYGITKNLTAVISPFIQEAWQAGNDTGMSLGNIILGGKYKLWEKDWSVFSGQLMGNIPVTRQVFSDSANNNTLINTDQGFIDGSLLFGTGGIFSKKNQSTWYASFEGGYKRYLNGAADQVHLDMQLGWKSPGEKWVLELKSLNAISVHNASQQGSRIDPIDFTLSTLALSGLYWFKPTLGLQVGVYQDVYGVNIGKGTQPFISLWWRSSKM